MAVRARYTYCYHLPYIQATVVSSSPSKGLSLSMDSHPITQRCYRIRNVERRVMGISPTRRSSAMCTTLHTCETDGLVAMCSRLSGSYEIVCNSYSLSDSMADWLLSYIISTKRGLSVTLFRTHSSAVHYTTYALSLGLLKAAVPFLQCTYGQMS